MAAVSFEKLFNHSPNPYMLLDRDFRYVAVNEAYLEVTASRREDLIGRHLFEAFPDDPDDPNRRSTSMLRASLERAFQTGQPDTIALIPYKVPQQTPIGVVTVERYWSATHTPILDENGEVQYILQHTVDVSGFATPPAPAVPEAAVPPAGSSLQLQAGVLQRAQQVQEVNAALDAERRRLLHLFDQAPGFVCVLRGPDHVFEIANRAYYQVIGHRDILGKTLAEALPEVAAQGFVKLLDEVYASRKAFIGRHIGVSVQRERGGEPSQIYVDFVYQPVVEADGSVSGIFVQGYEVTEQVQAQEELRQHREHLEELVQERTKALADGQAALQQAQKMEAVGRLTGGVAHDFNNLLQIIAGNLQLLQRDVSGNPAAQRRLRSAISAVDRGAKLASQLLAFARRQPLEPAVINLGKLVRNMDDLLRHAIGETVEVETVISGGLWNTFCDPAQVENAILNLAINARDAMDGEGKLTIEVGNAMLDDHYAAAHSEVTAGQYVMLAVSDTGCGMPPEVLARAFEPFFTTKPSDQGTGLGLSMVYGFVKQTGGHIKIYSEVGHGTTIKIYLPRALEAEAIVPEVPSGPIEGGSEVILVVEDDAQVRDTVVELLTDLGYRVLRAADGQSALAILQSGIPIDLLFTDVVMPGPVRSPELARQAKALLPDIEILFTSGYTENAIVHGGRLDPGVKLLSKPYRQEDLARKIAHMLRNRRQRAALAKRAPAPAQPPVQNAQGCLRILLVEDEADVRQPVAEFFRELGHMVVALGTAEAALGALAEERFDVLLTDVSLPGMSGLELAAAAKERVPALAIVIASGYGRTVGEDTGADYEWLPKPYDLAALEELLERLQERPGMEAEASQ